MGRWHIHFESVNIRRSMKMSFLFSCWSIVISLLLTTNVANGFILINQMNTTTVAVYETTTVNTYAVCAVVTTASPSAVTNCRRRRRQNYWIDPAFYISLKNNDDLQLSEAQQFINPTKTHRFKVEPTSSAFKTNPFEEYRVNHNFNQDSDLFLLPGYYLTPSGVIVQPSMNAEEKLFDPAKMSLKWMALMAFLKNKFMSWNVVGNVFMALNADASTMTSSTTSIVTVVATVSTKTYVISGCRPSSPAIPACY